MRYGRVKSVVITGFRNAVFNQGDEVNENQFPVGRFDELVKAGSIEIDREDDLQAKPPIKDEVEFGYVETEEIPQGIKERMASIKLELNAAGIKYKDKATFDELSQLLNDHKENPKEPVKTEKEKQAEDFDDTTRKEIMGALDERGVKYNKNASKQELYEIYRSKK